MDEWRKEWRRNGLSMIAAAFGLYVARLSAAQQVVVASHGITYTIPPPHQWLVWIFLALAVCGAWAWLSTYVPWLPMFGRRSAGRPDCSLSILTEYVPDMSEPRGDIDFTGCTYVFVAVENIGDTANFAAQFSNVKGLHRSDGQDLDQYFGKVSWEDTVEDRQVLGTGSTAKLMVMSLFTHPVAGWFQIPYSAKWAAPGDTGRCQLAGWCLVPDEPGGTLSFDLKVINETKKGSGTWHIEIPWNPDGTVSSTTLAQL